jgi:hypothetical protein
MGRPSSFLRWRAIVRRPSDSRRRTANGAPTEAARRAQGGRFGAISVAIAVAGCAHTELNSNTLDVASTIESLYREQALSNLSKLI